MRSNARRFHPFVTISTPLALSVLLVIVSACGDSTSSRTQSATPTVTVYSGRSEKLIAPLLSRFTTVSGVRVQTRYGDSAELTATLMEEGPRTPADVFIAQDAGELVALSRAGRLQPLAADLVERIPARFRSPEGDWVGLSGRARVVVFNTERLRTEQLPGQLDEVADPRFAGRFGIAPINASFQAHMAFVLATQGEPALVRLLAGLAANRPRIYANNGAIVQAVIAGEIDFGLVNHYYLWRALHERPQAPAANFFLPGGGASSFVNVSGAAVLSTRNEAIDLVRFLVADEAQRYFATETFEYPLVEGIVAAADLPPLDAMATAPVDYGTLGDALPRALELIHDSGLAQFR